MKCNAPGCGSEATDRWYCQDEKNIFYTCSTHRGARQIGGTEMTEKVDGLVAKYVKLRDFKEASERDMKEKIAKVKTEMGKIEIELMTFLNQTGQEAANTKSGTFYKRTTTSCTVADWDVIFAFIQEKELYGFLNHAVNKTGIEEYIEAHKEVPPGINLTREVALTVNRPKTR